MEKKSLGLILMFAIMLILGVAFISEVSNSIYQDTNIYSTNESVAISSGTAVTLNEDVIALTYFGNNSNSSTQGWVINTIVNYTTSQDAVTTITVDTGDIADGNYYAAYTYYPDGYIKTSSGRNIARIIPLMFAIAIMSFAIYYFKKNYDMNIGDMFDR